MSRIVKKTAHGNYELKTSDKTYHICMCGLSKNQPFCDGSHKKTLDEQEGIVYEYAEDGTRVEIGMEMEGGCCGGGGGCCGGGGCGGGCGHEEEKK